MCLPLVLFCPSSRIIIYFYVVQGEGNGRFVTLVVCYTTCIDGFLTDRRNIIYPTRKLCILFEFVHDIYEERHSLRERERERE